MPQLDSLTFAPIIFYVFILYIGGYIVLNLTVFVELFDKLKNTFTLLNFAYNTLQFNKKRNAELLNFPFISL